jgi:uncharacterized protein (DUF488 family)
MDEPQKTVWTIGHSTLTLEAFIGLLRAHRIEILADVRLLPGSRRFPHFNSEALAASLSQADVEYKHFPNLGGRRKPRPDSHNNAWRNESFRGYADYMETTDFQRAAQELTTCAARKRTAVMCAEAVWWQCHRALISDWLKVRGVEVMHILSENKVEPHPFTSAANVTDGQLSYRAPRGDATTAELPLS